MKWSVSENLSADNSGADKMLEEEDGRNPVAKIIWVMLSGTEFVSVSRFNAVPEIDARWPVWMVIRPVRT